MVGSIMDDSYHAAIMRLPTSYHITMAITLICLLKMAAWVDRLARAIMCPMTDVSSA